MGSQFTLGLTTPFGLPALLLALLVAGIWTEQLGRSESWRVPAAFLAGIAVGVALRQWGAILPQPALGQAASLIVIGVLAAGAIRPPSIGAMIITVLVAVYPAYVQIGSARFGVLEWAGAAAGSFLALAGGIGMAAIVGRALSARAVRAGGVATAAIGVWLLAPALQ